MNLHEVQRFIKQTLHDHWQDESWEIHDDKGLLLKGTQSEMLYAWEINSLASWAFKEIYGDIPRNPLYIIKEFYGSLKLIHIVSERNLEHRNHTWEEVGFE